jgi:hypothetical protein
VQSCLCYFSGTTHVVFGESKIMLESGTRYPRCQLRKVSRHQECVAEIVIVTDFQKRMLYVK